ncbi:hypothetical protein ACFL5Z_00040 [Planctomycetota bacterium]
MADLFLKVFKRRQSPSPLPLQSYFEKLYFTHPSYDESMSSLVYEDKQGNIRGFIGGIPVDFKLKNRKIRALVAGNHMVDRDLKDPMAGALLLRKFISGPQDLTYTDTANSISVKLWKTVGAGVLFSHSIRWIRLLRPGRFINHVLKRHPVGTALSWVAYPACLLSDVAYAHLFDRSSDDVMGRLDECELETSTMLESFEDFRDRRVLIPDYDEASLKWRLSLAESKQEHGELLKVAVYNKTKLQGWYLVYVRKGGVAYLLQLVAHPKSILSVLDHLFTNGRKRGCLALTGYLDPKYIMEYQEAGCFLFNRGAMAMSHTQDPEIRCALLHGDAYISSLEGEWWTRLQGDEFL